MWNYYYYYNYYYELCNCGFPCLFLFYMTKRVFSLVNLCFGQRFTQELNPREDTYISTKTREGEED